MTSDSSDETDAPFRFDLTGGAPALDFVNTVDGRGRTDTERFTSYDRLADWSVQTGVAGEAEAARLREAPADAAKRALADALRFRDMLFELFGSVARGDAPSEAALAGLNSWLGRAAPHQRLRRSDGAFELVWGEAADDPEMPLWRVTADAVRLLADNELRRRLRMCEGANCGWLFLDHSRQGNRRWCDMRVCGNREKARRHSGRKRATAKGRGAGR